MEHPSSVVTRYCICSKTFLFQITFNEYYYNDTFRTPSDFIDLGSRLYSRYSARKPLFLVPTLQLKEISW